MNEVNPNRINLHSWTLHPADSLNCEGSVFSTSAFDPGSGYKAECPGTVLAVLVATGEYPDPYHGTRLQDIPLSRFSQPWWYRTEFELEATVPSQTVMLECDGINYAANIWLNGQQVADSEDIRGAFRRFQFDVSPYLQPKGNVLTIEVIPPKPGDFSTGFVDWNPAPPDGNMGLFRPVSLHCCAGVSLEDPFVQVDLDTDSLDRAELIVVVDVVNHRNASLEAEVQASIEDLTLSQKVTLAPHERKPIRFIPVEYPELRLKEPRLWWPCQLGDPNLYELQLEVTADDMLSDTVDVTFGIRHVEDYFNDKGHRGYRINGKEILIKAGGWSDDLLLADAPEKLEAQIQYVAHMNLNAIRLEAIWGKDHTLYNLCDRYGILMMVGWSCHWEHEQYLGKPVDERFGGITSPEDIDLIARSWSDQVRWLRNHPSIFVWTVGSDKVPHPDLERRYCETFAKYDPTRPYLASTGGVGSEQAIIGSEVIVSDISGPTGVKMLGPYAYTPPLYWYENNDRGSAYGFNTETGPGAQVPVLDSLKRMLPAEDLWPINEAWDFHCGLNEFVNLDRFVEALTKRYGPVDSLEEFAFKAQVLNYELMRPMFEAFRVHKGRATGVVQWMLNAAWPKMYWQLYDWYLVPTGAFYGAKKACEPLHLIYDYARRSIHLVNDTLNAYEAVTARIRVFDLHGKVCFQEIRTQAVTALSSQTVLSLPEFPGITNTYFLDLQLTQGNRQQTNTYWLSTKADVLDYDAKVEPWEFYTPSLEYADYTQLRTLKTTSLSMQTEFNDKGDPGKRIVTVSNTGDHIAFAVELTLQNKTTHQPLVPVFWDDNYLTLFPGESRTVEVKCKESVTEQELLVHGWNID